MIAGCSKKAKNAQAMNNVNVRIQQRGGGKQHMTGTVEYRKRSKIHVAFSSGCYC